MKTGFLLSRFFSRNATYATRWACGLDASIHEKCAALSDILCKVGHMWRDRGWRVGDGRADLPSAMGEHPAGEQEMGEPIYPPRWVSSQDLPLED